jgi:hypothetical protein
MPPVIESWSGLALDDQDWTLSVSGAGAKAFPKPTLYDDFEAQNFKPSPLGIIQAYSGGGGVGYSTVNPYSGKVCAASTPGWRKSATGMHIEAALGFGRGEKFYLHVKDFSTQTPYFDPSNPGHNTKGPFRWWAGKNGGYPDLIMGGAEADGSTIIAAESCVPIKTGLNRIYPPGGLATPLQGVWRTVEIIGQYSSAPGASDGYLELRINGKVEGVISGFQFDTANLPGVSNYLVLEWVCANNSAEGWCSQGDHAFDQLYVETGTWQRVVLANAPVLAQASIVEPQIPTAWSDTSIVVKSRVGRLPPGTAYLFVCDANGVFNDTGFSVLL